MCNQVPNIQQIEKSETGCVLPRRHVHRVLLAIATTGRKDVLSRTLSHLHRQTVQPDLLVISIASEADIDRAVLQTLPCPVEIKIGPKGACHQRNRVLEVITPNDVVVFIDDDFLMADSYLERVGHVFTTHPDVVMATGEVLADGISGPGYSHDFGMEILAQFQTDVEDFTLLPSYNGYGCNMAFRTSPVVDHGVRFDETLPLYAWLEDVDFSRQLSAYGRIVKSNSLTGVHLGTKMGRTNGKSFGYSQISNPLYLMDKGTMIPSRALKMLLRNLVANCIKSLRPEPWVDRRGRLYGNALALGDLIRGKLTPTRVIQFTK